MSSLKAVFDACVLYPAPLRDLLMHLSLTDLFSARWTDEIHEEWIRSVLDNRPDLKRSQLERTRRLMNENVLDCVVTGYENLIDGLELPDPDDRHVLAAAIRAGAAVIVTFNTRDFPADVLRPLGIEAIHPDSFIARLIEHAPGKVCTAAKRQRANLKNPPKNVDEYLDALERQQLSETVVKLSVFKDLI